MGSAEPSFCPLWNLSDGSVCPTSVSPAQCKNGQWCNVFRKCGEWWVMNIAPNSGDHIKPLFFYWSWKTRLRGLCGWMRRVTVLFVTASAQCKDKIMLMPCFILMFLLFLTPQTIFVTVYFKPVSGNGTVIPNYNLWNSLLCGILYFEYNNFVYA